MRHLLQVAILALGTASYSVGVHQIVRRQYAPSVFSRLVWLLLAGNSLAGVIATHSSLASVLLAGISLAGNAAMCAASMWRGTRTFGQVEFACSLLLVLSAIVWLGWDAPFLNLVISLLAHLFGAVPTLQRVWRSPASESVGFWSLFFAASILSLLDSWGQPLRLVVYPAYYAMFDGTLMLLALRRVRV